MNADRKCLVGGISKEGLITSLVALFLCCIISILLQENCSKSSDLMGGCRSLLLRGAAVRTWDSPTLSNTQNVLAQLPRGPGLFSGVSVQPWLFPDVTAEQSNPCPALCLVKRTSPLSWSHGSSQNGCGLLLAQIKSWSMGISPQEIFCGLWGWFF